MTEALTRRTLLAAAALTLTATTRTRAAPRQRLALELVPTTLPLRPGLPATPAWRFAPAGPLRVRQGDTLDVTVANRLPAEMLVHWRGWDGQPALEPLLARGPIAPGATADFALALPHAGTLLCNAWLGDGALPLPALPIVVAETAPPQADRDEVLLIEDWRLRPDGSAIPPGTDPTGAAPLYTLNGEPAFKLLARSGERLRLRFINATQRSVIAIRLSDSDLRVIAIDGQPSEPFPARDGRLVLAPGSRIDAIVDMSGTTARTLTLNDGERSVPLGEISVGGTPSRAQPLPDVTALPTNGLPDRLALQTALRIDMPLDSRAGWIAGAAVTAATAPLFRVKRGRPVVLALANPGDSTMIFHLHGHHMRLLDRLDDGWKPFWLDTVAVPAKQTVRVAFAATHAGNYLMETTGTSWGSSRGLRSYTVDA